MNMSVVMNCETAEGATVIFRDDEYADLGENELRCRRENMIKTAEQVAQSAAREGELSPQNRGQKRA